MSDNGEKIITPEEPAKPPTEIMFVDLDEAGRIRINIKTACEPLLINALYYINKAVDEYLTQQQMKQQQIQVAQSKISQDLMNRLRGK